MHERTERAIARLMFVFCCAVPTLITLLVIAVTWTPWYHDAQLRQLTSALSSETGLTVTIKDFKRISPTKWTLEDVRLFAPETHAEVASVREVTWLSGHDRNGLLLRQPKLQASQLRHAWGLIHDRFLCRPERTAVALQLSANDLTIHSVDGDMTLRDVDALVQPLAEAIQANIHCLPAYQSSGSPVEIDIRRDRGARVPKTQWSLQSGDTPLLCSSLADWMPQMKKLGADAEFTGRMNWEIDANGLWTIDLAGSNFWNIDLSRLCEDMPDGLRAKHADLRFDRGFIEPGKSVNVSGSLRARRGYIGQSLLRSAIENLYCDVDPRVMEVTGGDVWFDLFAVHFRISDSNMELDGICGNERGGYEILPPGVAMCINHQTPIVRTGQGEFSALRLTRVLSPRHSELVPLASQTKGWMDLLIAPSHMGLPANGLAPTGRIRKVEHWSGGEPIKQR